MNVGAGEGRNDSIASALIIGLVQKRDASSDAMSFSTSLARLGLMVEASVLLTASPIWTLWW